MPTEPSNTKVDKKKPVGKDNKKKQGRDFLVINRSLRPDHVSVPWRFFILRIALYG